MTPTETPAPAGRYLPVWTIAPIAVLIEGSRSAVTDVADPEVVRADWDGDLLRPVGETTALPKSLARYALACGVQRWSTQSLDEGVLDVDVALAAMAAGHTDTGRAGLRRRAGTVLAMAEAAAERETPPALAAGVAEAVAATVSCLSDMHPLASHLQSAHAELRTADLARESVDWEEVIQQLLTASKPMAFAAAPTDPAEAAGRWVDLRLLPARMLAIGRDFDELTVTVTAQARGFRVTLPTLPGVDENSLGADRILIRASDRSTGRLMDTAVAHVTARAESRPGTLSGLLDLHDADPASVDIDFFDASSDLASRFGPTRPARIRTDGHAIHGWSLARLFAAARLFSSDRPLGRAQCAAAADALTAAAADAVSGSQPERHHALARLQAGLREQIAHPIPTQRPLLAELWQIYTHQ